MVIGVQNQDTVADQHVCCNLNVTPSINLDHAADVRAIADAQRRLAVSAIILSVKPAVATDVHTVANAHQVRRHQLYRVLKARARTPVCESPALHHSVQADLD